MKEKSRPDAGCIFYPGYRGYCNNDVGPFEDYCDNHKDVECWKCGEQAQKSCAVKECEIIECVNCPHYFEEH